MLLAVTVPWAEASVHQNIPLNVHRISNELIKCTCEESFAVCYFQPSLIIGHVPCCYFSPAALNMSPRERIDARRQ